MTSRVLREIPLKILHRKVGDEHVTLLQACYDNPIFGQDDPKNYPQQNGAPKTGIPADYGPEVYEDGVGYKPDGKRSGIPHSLDPTDYMHSLPVDSLRMPSELTFREHRKKARRLVCGIVILAVVMALVIGLLIHYVGSHSSSSSSSSVITVSSIECQLSITDGPFSQYSPEYSDQSSPAFLLLSRVFVYKINSIFVKSSISHLYNRTKVVFVYSSKVASPFNENAKDKKVVSIRFLLLPPSNVLMEDEIESRVKNLLVKGFKSGLFFIDDSSISVTVKTFKTEQQVIPKPGTCQPVLLTECMSNTTENKNRLFSISYSSTSYPNILGHRSPQVVEETVKKFKYLFELPCYEYQQDFYCSLFSPECGPEGRPIHPCRSYCQDVMEKCSTMYSQPMFASWPKLPVSCDELPESDDPNICRQNPYKPGVCVPMSDYSDYFSEVCKSVGVNHTVFPNVAGGVSLDMKAQTSMHMMIAVDTSTNCFEHTKLFACSLFAPRCSGRPYPHHYIPPCASLCQAYRDRCEIFLDIFSSPWPENVNCSALPDSPDPSVCIGYNESRRPEVIECGEGEIMCGSKRCIKATWLCDGFQDCEDNSDEQHCATCGVDEMSCSPASSLCVKKTDGCDGKNDCYMDVDEHYCVQVNLEESSEQLQAYNTVSDQWEDVCQDGWTQDFSDLVCKQLGYRTALTTYYTVQTSKFVSRITELRNNSDPKSLQSYLKKGYKSCPSGNVAKVVCFETMCGLRPAHFTLATRVVGGKEAMPGSWPWMAALHGGAGQKFFCGSTILNDRWILTAAHCVGGADKDPSYWHIKSGGARRIAFSEHRQTRKPKRIFRHPGYSAATVEHDIALIQLAKPFSLNDFVRPICLPEINPPPGERCFATGWGKTIESDLDYQPAMKQVALDVTSFAHCEKAYNSADQKVPFKLTPTMFCAGGTHGHDSCSGDSGGPLVCRKPNTTDEWYQSGIVSWGLSCAVPDVPGVYTNLTLYVDWIHQIMSNYTGVD